MMRVLSPGHAELLVASRAIEDSGRQVVAPFHSHRRRLSTAHIRRDGTRRELRTCRIARTEALACVYADCSMWPLVR